MSETNAAASHRAQPEAQWIPHWGKVFDPAQFDFPALYPRRGDAQHAFAASDPTAMFRNVWFDMTFG